MSILKPLPPPPMLAQRLLRLQVVYALQEANTAASYGWFIETPGDTPTDGDVQLPNLMVRGAHTRDTQWSRGQPGFTSTITIDVEGKVQARAPKLTQQDAQDAIEQLAFLVKNTLLSNYSLLRVTQQVSAETIFEVTSETKHHTGAFKMSLSFEMPETYDVYAIPPNAYATWPEATPQAFPMLLFQIDGDLLRPFDPNGTYPPGDFPASVNPAPRTSGPDGRNELNTQVALT